MENTKLMNYLPQVAILITCTMFIWTVNYICACEVIQTPTAIAAFSA